MINYDDLIDGAFDNGTTDCGIIVNGTLMTLTPLDVQLKPAKGFIHVWKAVKVFKNEPDEVTDDELLGKGYSPVAPSVYPKLPINKEKNRIEWKGLVLCVAADKSDVYDVMRENKDEIFNFLFVQHTDFWGKTQELIRNEMPKISSEELRKAINKMKHDEEIVDAGEW